MNCTMSRLLVLAACLAIGCTAAIEKKKDSVKLTMFYESYCPSCISSITTQLMENWEYFKQHLQLDLVPFGNAEQTYENGHFVFTCQHGPKECIGNILHSCAIHEACGDKGTFHCPVPKLKKALDYINCVVQQADQQQASDSCATQSGLTSKVINKCANGKLGNMLESRYGNQTSAFRPKVDYVAFFAVNNKHDANIQNQAETDLKGLICSYLPDQCK